MTEKLTVLIPCKNERSNLAPCIASVRDVADEVLVADSGSTDGSLEMLQRWGGCRVIERDYVHSGDFKNWAIPQARHAWVLILDADERLTPELRGEIRRLLDAEPPYDGYWIFRQNHFLGHRVRFSGWQSDRCLRLFRRDMARYEGDTDHAEIVVRSGRVGRLRHRMLHFTYASYDEYFRKFHRYTKFQAEAWFRAGKRPSILRLLVNGPFRFLHAYVVRLGVLDGWVGLQLSALTGFYSFVKQARLWECWFAAQRAEKETLEDLVRRTAA